MALKRTITAEEFAELPESLQTEYGEEKEGKHTLSVDDDVENKKKLNSFRKRNKDLHDENETLKTTLKTFDGVDPAKWQEGQEALEVVGRLSDADLLKEGKVDEAIDAQVDRKVLGIKQDFEAKVKAKDTELQSATQERDTVRRRFQNLKIDSGIQTAANAVGKLRPGAMSDVISRAHRVWHVDDEGNEAAKDSAGEPIYGPEGDPISMQEWMQGLLEDAPHLFEGGGGGGAGGGTKGGAAGGGRSVSNDPLTMGKNVEAIAKGKVQVRES